MTDNEIIKVYDGLTARQQLNIFRNLHYKDGNTTESGIIANAINEILPEFLQQKAEIEQLRKTILDGDFSSYTALKAKEDWHRQNGEYIDRLKAENERLEDLLDSAVSSERNAVETFQQEKAEAIKEFAERLKSRVIMSSFSPQLGVIWCFGERAIDNIVKEMLGEDNVD